MPDPRSTRTRLLAAEDHARSMARLASAVGDHAARARWAAPADRYGAQIDALAGEVTA